MTLMPATTAPPRSCTGTAIERKPASSCWSAIAKPLARTSCRYPRSDSSEAMVRDV
jgi:hypothetical protein